MNQQAINQSINIIFYFITLTVNSWIDFSGTDGEDPIPLHTLSLSASDVYVLFAIFFFSFLHTANK